MGRANKTRQIHRFQQNDQQCPLSFNNRIPISTFSERSQITIEHMLSISLQITEYTRMDTISFCPPSHSHVVPKRQGYPALGTFATHMIGILSLVIIQVFGIFPFGHATDGRVELEDITQHIQQIQHQIDETLLRVNKLGLEGHPSQVHSVESIDEQMQKLFDRMDAQEDLLQDLEQKVGSRALVRAFDATQFDFGGFLHSTFTHINGENGSATSFDRLTFELLFKIQFSERFSAFFAQAFIRESNTRFTDTFQRTSPGFAFSGSGGMKTPLVIAWANYRQSDALNIQIGRYITPFGIINIEHFPAILLDPEQPQFLRPFSGDTIFPNFMTGVQVHGQMFFADDSLQYNVYTGLFTGSSPEQFYTGIRGAYTFGQLGSTVGINLGTGKRSLTTTAPETIRPSQNSTFYMYGIDLLIDNGPILWKSELFFTDEDSRSGGNRFAYYTQPAYRINDQWIAFYRYDFLNDGSLQIAPTSGGPRLQSPGNSTEHVLGMNFLPVPNVRLRASFTLKEFSSGRLGAQNAQAQILQLSGTFSF